MPDTIPHPDGDPGHFKEDLQPRIPPPETKPRVREDSVADAFEKDTRQQLSFLREKTFNSDLRHLVDRIRDNEPSSADMELSQEDIDSLSEEELQIRLYRLYYRAVNIRDNRDINIAFSPFDIQEDASSSSIVDSLNSYIISRMESLGLSPFALLSYNIAQKGYMPAIHSLERYSAEGIVIGLRDRLFKKISASPDGLIIDPAEIEEDPFMRKIFSLKEGEGHRPLYFIMVSTIIAEVMKELPISDADNLAPFLPSAIIMLELPDHPHAATIAAIAGTVKRRLALPYFLLNDYQSLVFSSDNYENLDYTYRVLDYLFTIFLLRKDRAGISIQSTAQKNESMTFLIKYVISKLSHKLYCDSVIVHVIKGRLVILTTAVFIDVIRDIVDEYNRLFNDQFSIVEFYSADFNDSLDIIQRIIFNN
jgi:hypothetical protein